MPIPPGIKFIFNEIQVVSRLDYSYYMLHRISCHVLRDISFVEDFLKCDSV
jgi:hypothetical protein